MSRRKRTKRWLREHERDPFVQSAKRAGYRSRAAYKLLQLEQRDRLFRPGGVVVDLGAAPGGWSQVAAERVGEPGKVVALDRLVMAPLPGVVFVEGDFFEAGVADRVAHVLGAARADIVMSDMAPNLSGIRDADQARALELALGALTFAERVIKPSGTLLVKTFQGEALEALMNEARPKFATLVTRKPGASRDRSSEVYVLARGYGV